MDVRPYFGDLGFAWEEPAQANEGRRQRRKACWVLEYPFGWTQTDPTFQFTWTCLSRDPDGWVVAEQIVSPAP